MHCAHSVNSARFAVLHFVFALVGESTVGVPSPCIAPSAAMSQHSELQSLVRGPASDAKANLNPLSSYLEMASHPVLADPVSSKHHTVLS